MRHYFTWLPLLFMAILGHSQSDFSPTVLILSPTKTSFDKDVEKELKKNVDEYIKNLDLNAADAFLLSEEFKKRPKNIQLMSKSEIDYLRNFDHTKLTSYLAEQFLAYKLYEKFKNVLIKLDAQISTNELNQLTKIAEDKKVNFILSFNELTFYKERKKIFVKMDVSLFDKASNKLLLNSVYVGDDSNPGFEFSCKDGSVNCTINNALFQIVKDVANQVALNDPFSKKAVELEKNRNEILKNNYLKKSFEAKNLAEIIPLTDKSIDLGNAYQMIFNENKTLCVAFFIENVPESGGKEFHDKKNDRNINIVSENQMDVFKGKYPNKYAYIVKAVLYKGKWYYEKAEVTYFDAENLESGKEIYMQNLVKWGFYKENSAEVNPDFWKGSEDGYTLETKNLFRIVSGDDERIEFRGMFTIVVEQLKENK